MSDNLTWQDFLPLARAISAAYRGERPPGFDPQNTVLSGTLGAVLQSDNQHEANRDNRRNALRTNAWNKRMFYESRGQKGNAVLPMYLKNADGTPFEQALGQDMMDIYDVTNDAAPADEMSRYRDVVARFQPAQDRADEFSNKIFTGGITDEMLANAKPVQQARLEIAPMKKQAAIEALTSTLNDINAAQAAQGFSGDGLGKRLLEFNARRAANTDAADAAIAAKLANATETQQIQNYGSVALPLQNLDLPYKQTRRAVDVLQLPENVFLDQYARRIQPFGFVKLGGAAPFEYKPLPQVDANSSVGALLAQAGSGAGQMALNYYLRNQQRQDQQQAYNSYLQTQYGGRLNGFSYGGRAPDNWNSMTTPQQVDYMNQVQSADQWIANNPEIYAAYQ